MEKFIASPYGWGLKNKIMKEEIFKNDTEAELSEADDLPIAEGMRLLDNQEIISKDCIPRSQEFISII